MYAWTTRFSSWGVGIPMLKVNSYDSEQVCHIAFSGFQFTLQSTQLDYYLLIASWRLTSLWWVIICLSTHHHKYLIRWDLNLLWSFTTCLLLSSSQTSGASTSADAAFKPVTMMRGQKPASLVGVAALVPVSPTKRFGFMAWKYLAWILALTKTKLWC